MKTQTDLLISGDLLDDIIERHKGKPGMLLTTLEEAQENHPWKYLPGEPLGEKSHHLLHTAYRQRVC